MVTENGSIKFSPWPTVRLPPSCNLFSVSGFVSVCCCCVTVFLCFVFLCFCLPYGLYFLVYHFFVSLLLSTKSLCLLLSRLVHFNILFLGSSGVLGDTEEGANSDHTTPSLGDSFLKIMIKVDVALFLSSCELTYIVFLVLRVFVNLFLGWMLCLCIYLFLQERKQFKGHRESKTKSLLVAAPNGWPLVLL